MLGSAGTSGGDLAGALARKFRNLGMNVKRSCKLSCYWSRPEGASGAVKTLQEPAVRPAIRLFC